jgi:arylsulfatase A-like enzyme
MYEESFRTPLLMRLPGGAKGINNELVQNIDYAPTFLEAAGIDIPDDIQGESLLPLLKGKTELEGRNALYYHYFEYPAEHMVKRHNGIRTDRYKLIHYYNDIDVWELYDLQNDPNEMNNIYGQEGTEKLTRELKQQLAELQTKYGEEEYIAE